MLITRPFLKKIMLISGLSLLLTPAHLLSGWASMSSGIHPSQESKPRKLDPISYRNETSSTSFIMAFVHIFTNVEYITTQTTALIDCLSNMPENPGSCKDMKPTERLREIGIGLKDFGKNSVVIAAALSTVVSIVGMTVSVDTAVYLAKEANKARSRFEEKITHAIHNTRGKVNQSLQRFKAGVMNFFDATNQWLVCINPKNTSCTNAVIREKAATLRNNLKVATAVSAGLVAALTAAYFSKKLVTQSRKTAIIPDKPTHNKLPAYIYKFGVPTPFKQTEETLPQK